MTKELENIIQQGQDEDEKMFVATQWQLMWWKFRKHKMALYSAVVIIIMYIMAAFCEFFAPYDPEQFFPKYKLAPPSRIRIFHQSKLMRPFVRLYTDYLTNRQAQLNIFYHYMIHHLVRANILLKADLEALQHKVEQLQAVQQGGEKHRDREEEQA